MIYQTLSATFGALKGKTLELKDGLNIVSGENESGKSTWSAFLRVMLYGVATRERSTKDSLPDKEKYAPWSGDPMYGKLTLTARGRALCIERTAGKRDRFFKNLTVTDLQTGLPAEIIGATPGEALLGVREPVFERSALAGQGRLAVGNDDKGELLRRIQALAQTGDEESSFTEAKSRLEAWKRERRYNRRGRLPELEAERDALRAALLAQSEETERLKAIQTRQEEIRARLERAKQNRDACRAAVAAQKLAEIRAAEERCARSTAPTEAEFAELAALEQEMKRAETAYTACLEREPQKNVSRETLLPAGVGIPVGAGLCAALWLVFGKAWLALGVGAAFAVAIIAAWRGRVRAERRKFRAAEIQEAERARAAGRSTFAERLAQVAPGAADLDEVRQRVQDAQIAKERREILTKGVDVAALEALAAQAGTVETVGTPEDAERAVLALEQELRTVENAGIALESKLETSADPARDEARIAEIETLLAKGEREYAAIERAIAVLTEVNGELTQRIAPKLAERAGEMFHRVTGGRFDTVELKEGLLLSVREQGEAQPRGLLSLSAGTLDELYLCLRLALCESLFDEEPVPILLDDALVNYDDARAARMLTLLREMARERQIVLFTCHAREREFFGNDPEVHCISL